MSEVKDFMQTLYKDDNVVVGQLDAVRGQTKVPQAALDPKTWSATYSCGRKRTVSPAPSAADRRRAHAGAEVRCQGDARLFGPDRRRA
ncbi:hypothetical protein AB5I41_09235 [Sphingomonas sp. MMS24-JH45]